MKLIITADEFGRTKAMSETILDCFDNGYLVGASIVPTGYGFEHAIRELKKRPKFRLGIHLDLCEGVPLSRPSEIPLLVDSTGKLKCSFLSLWLNFVLFPNQRGRLRNQVKKELKAQIMKVKKNAGSKHPLHIDSHNHLHMIPFVFNILMDISKEMPFFYMRLAIEPFFLCYDGPVSVFNYFGLNIVKHFLLKILSLRHMKVLVRQKVRFPRYFIGVLFTGCNSAKSIKEALSRIYNSNKSEEIEILFHPGIASKNEQKYWKDDEYRKRYYYSINREKENDTLKSKEFGNLISKFDQGI